MAKNAEQLEQLTAYLDGELSDAERKKVETLLAQNEDARQLLDELRQTSKLLASLPHAPAPTHLANTISDQLERAALLGEDAGDPVGTSSGNTWFKGLAIAASIALVCTAGWFMWPELPFAVQDDTSVFTLADAKSSQGEIDLDSEEVSPHEKSKQSPQTETLAFAKKRTATPGAARTKGTTKAAPADLRKTPGMRGSASSGGRGRPRSPLPPDERTNLAKPDAGKSGEQPPIIVEDRQAVEEHQAHETITEAENKDNTELFLFDRTATPDQPPQKMAVDLAESTHGNKGPAKAPLSPTKPTLGVQAATAHPAMTNAIMRQITASSESNRFVMETDDATQKEIALYVRSFVADNGIPNANNVTFPEPIPPTQRFFVAENEQTARAQVTPKADSPIASEIRFVLNAPVDQVKELLHNVNLISTSNNALSNCTANGISIVSDDLPASVLGAMMSPPTPSTPAKPRRRAALSGSDTKPSFARPTGVAAEATDTDEDREDDSDEADPQSNKKEPPEDTKKPGQLSIGSPQRGAWVVCTAPHVDKPAYIRLAILLRSNSPEPSGEKVEPQKEKDQISAPLPHRPTSHPTTGETPRG